ncbi:segregation/condensation protein A [Clostridium vincentii]|uniref:Segregation and condensation protein A n=1 Tax=Clostridium vincentii TaxID=52704 RepID=A0A2T0BAL3_9CLOT|nr:segregation/condensation protein A [Clostridium vincentii]PRR80882.1 Segregation and condensation protein A [Clostridium vincentii]
MKLPNIKIDNFEGPFDLLLHLIKKNKMDIYNVEILKVTSQYLNYLDQMKEMDLDITAEFIVVAATLIEIKSKSLLPKEKEVKIDEEDIERKLLEKLVIYKEIKESTGFFRERYVEGGNIFTKKPEIIEEIKSMADNDDILKNVTLLDLFQIYNDILEIHKNKQNKTNVIQKKIYLDRYKVEDKFKYLTERLKKDKVTQFDELILECECKMECVVTFLALLEMIKQRIIKVYQSSNFGNIIIERLGEEDECV